MGRIPKQRDPFLAPAIEWFTIIERPFVVTFAGFYQLTQGFVPTGIAFHQFLTAACVGLGFFGPAITIQMRHKIDQFAAAHRIVDDMPMRAPPRRHILRVVHICDGLDRDQPPPANAAGEIGLDGSEQAFADGRMDAVGADNNIRLYFGAVYYNYKTKNFLMTKAPGISAFAKDPDGPIYHTYSCFRGGWTHS